MERISAQASRDVGFVGRGPELAELMAALDVAVEGSGRLVLVGGEPGVGKSRLADEFATRARERGVEVLWGRGWEDAGAPPYWPWVQVLRSHLRGAELDTVRRELGAGAGDVAQMLPDVRQMLPDVMPPPVTEPESARFQLFDSTTTFLRNAALERPLLIVLDDLQAADVPTLLLLRFLATQLSEMRALVAGTYRDVEVTPDHPLAATLAELTREPITRVLSLGGLPDDAVAQLLESATGIEPPAQFVSTVWRQTKGNPLFVGEAMRLLSAEAGIASAADLSSLRVAVPAGIREVISRRLGRLAEASVQVLAIGAVMGPEFSLDILRRVAEFESDELINLLDPAIEAGLLSSVRGGMGRFRFSHDLVREVLYDGLTISRRIRLHLRIAENLEQSGGAPEAHFAELAFHFFQAAQGAEPARGADGNEPAAKAIHYARRAADQAARSLAYEEAVRLLQTALAVLDAADGSDDPLRTEILLALADAQARAGELDASRARFLEAARTAQTIGEAGLLARAALGYGGRLPWTRPGHDTVLLPLLQDALVLLGGSDDRLRARLLARLACAWRSSPERRSECATLSKQALELARQIGDPGTLSYALEGRYAATWWPENPTDRLSIADEMVKVAEASGDAERLIGAYFMLFAAYNEIPRITEARRAEQEVIRLANELRQPAQRWLAITTQAMLALMGGDYEDAERFVDEELAWQNPLALVRDEVSSARMHLFLLRREQGRLAEVEEKVQAAVEDFPWYPLHRAALTNLLLDLDRAAEARAEFETLARDEFRSLYRDNEWLLGMSLSAEACSRLDDTSSAEFLYKQLRPFAGRHATGHPEGSVGAVDRYLGLLAATIGDLDAAERHFDAAIAVNEELGARPWVAHSQTDLALVLSRRGTAGDAARVDELRRSAFATGRELGMRALERRLSAEGAEPAVVDASSVEGGAAEAMFVREGDFWAIGRDRLFRLRHAKGLAYLNVLLANPGREFHVLELVSGPAATPTGVASSRAATLGLRSDPAAPTWEILDPQAKAAYRERLRELQDEVADADSAADPARGERAQAEIDAITAELSAAFGLGGRARPEGSPAERARQSVTKAVRHALRQIRAEDPGLGDHLARAVRTGLYCAYDPDPAAAVIWKTRSTPVNPVSGRPDLVRRPT